MVIVTMKRSDIVTSFKEYIKTSGLSCSEDLQDHLVRSVSEDSKISREL